MAFQRSVKLAAVLLLLAGLTGCSQQSSAQSAPAHILVPAGAPALATIGLDADTAEVEYVEGQDVLISELNKKDSEYDVIIAPINLGIKSWSEDENYLLDGIVTWGNLYLIGSDENWNVPGSEVAAFGEGAVPGLVFNEVFDDLSADVTFYPSVAEASQALMAQKADTALLAQPAAAAAMAKTEGTAVQADLQTLWQEKTGSKMKGYPQAALFVRKGSEEKARAVTEQMSAFLEKASDEEKQAKIEEIGTDKLGVPSAEMAVKTWDAQNIHYKKAADVQEDIEAFLKVFDMELPADILEK